MIHHADMSEAVEAGGPSSGIAQSLSPMSEQEALPGGESNADKKDYSPKGKDDSGGPGAEDIGLDEIGPILGLETGGPHHELKQKGKGLDVDCTSNEDKDLSGPSNGSDGGVGYHSLNQQQLTQDMYCDGPSSSGNEAQDSGGPRTTDTDLFPLPAQAITRLKCISEKVGSESNPLVTLIQTLAVWTPRERNRELKKTEYIVELPSNDED